MKKLFATLLVVLYLLICACCFTGCDGFEVVQSITITTAGEEKTFSSSSKPNVEFYEDYKYINEFDNGKSMLENKGNKASNGGAIMYGQGTSSMEYPVKNLRIRFKKDKYWYRVRPDIQKVEIICI